MGARRGRISSQFSAGLFQSTRPAWGRDVFAEKLAVKTLISIHTPRMGARPQERQDINGTVNFNPHAPHGGATKCLVLCKEMEEISIHTPRMGARRTVSAWVATIQAFQSTRPAWGRDHEQGNPLGAADISIHTPRMGARQEGFETCQIVNAFQSTRPAWGRD